MHKIQDIKLKATQKDSSRRQSIIDRYGRTFDYLRLAVNEICNLRCIYCMPEQGIIFKSKDKILQKREIFKLIKITTDLGVNKIRFTGGEPLLRKEIFEIINFTKKIKTVKSINLTTNGILLSDMLNELKSSGLSGINISIDTLNPEKYKTISRRDSLDEVLDSFHQITNQNLFKIKINVVAMKNFNDDELVDFVELTKDNDITVRFIELMPFDSRQIWKTGKFYKAGEILSDLKLKYNNLIKEQGSSTEYHIFRLKGYVGKVAIIPSYTRSLCGKCNRIRITADGNLLNCLYSQNGINLLSPIRNNLSNSEIKKIILEGMYRKPKDGWEAHKKGFEYKSSMTQIGG